MSHTSDLHLSIDSKPEHCQNGCHKTSSFSDSISFWMNGVLSLTLVVIGMIGNTAVVISFHCRGNSKMRHRRRQAFYYYLMTFAIWNTGLLVATVLFNCIPALLVTEGASSSLMHVSDVASLVGYMGGNCCVTANVWLAVTLTVERYLAVSRPLRSRLYSPRRRAKLVCILLSILVLVYNSPLLFEMTFKLDSDRVDPAFDDDQIDQSNAINANSTDTLIDDERSIDRFIDRPISIDQSAMIETARFADRFVPIVRDRLTERSVPIDTDESVISVDLSNGSMTKNRFEPTYKLRLSSMRDNFYYQFLYRVVANFLFVSFVPFSIILLLTIKIVCVVRESNRKRARFRKPTGSGEKTFAPIPRTASISFQPHPTTTPSSSRYADVVLTLIAAKFLFFYTLPVVINIVELSADSRAFETDDSEASKILKFLVELANLLVVFDGATNSFFYFSWRNRLRTRRYATGNSKNHNYVWLNLESRCTAAHGECSVGLLQSEGCTGVSRKRSKLEYSPQLPSTANASSFRNSPSDRVIWVPMSNARIE